MYYSIILLTVYAVSAAHSLSDQDMYEIATTRCKTYSEGEGCKFSARIGLCTGLTDKLKGGQTSKDKKEAERIRFEKVWEACPCSCLKAANERILTCCMSIGPRVGANRPECAHLCSHTLTAEKINNPSHQHCNEHLNILTYCASEGNDVRECCEQRGVIDRCLPFCKGGWAPNLCGLDLYAYQECITDTVLNKMRYCYLKGRARKPSWDQQYQPSCLEL